MFIRFSLKHFSAIFCLGILLVCLTSPAFALDLNEGRQKGLVGEQLDGYLGVVSGGADAQALAAEINARRKEEYSRISSANGQPVAFVAKLAAVQVIGGLPAGTLYQAPDGRWAKK